MSWPGYHVIARTPEMSKQSPRLLAPKRLANGIYHALPDPLPPRRKSFVSGSSKSSGVVFGPAAAKSFQLDSLAASLPIPGPLACRSASRADNSLLGCAATPGPLGISVVVSGRDRETSVALLARSGMVGAAEYPTGPAAASHVLAYYSPISTLSLTTRVSRKCGNVLVSLLPPIARQRAVH